MVKRFGSIFGSIGLFSFVIVACSGDDATATITAEQACDQAATALCDKIEKCSALLFSITVGTRAQCMERFKIDCPQNFTAVGTAATPARLSQCSRDVGSVDCEQLLAREPPESCRVVGGTLEDGAVCGRGDQCKNRLCRVAKGATCGACSSLGAPGATCAEDDECDYGLKCSAGKCLAYGKAGEACSDTQPCLPTLGCSNKVCTLTAGAGAPCTFRAGENPCDLLAGYYCHPKTQTCANVETAPAGGTCETSLERIVVCTGASSCKIPAGQPTGTCQAPASDGAQCNEDTGPKCLTPARCRNGICTITDPSTCK